MFSFGAKKPTTELGKLEKRLQVLPTHQLVGWADTYLNVAGQALLAHTREGGDLTLREAEEGATALLAVITELRRRT